MQDRVDKMIPHTLLYTTFNRTRTRNFSV